MRDFIDVGSSPTGEDCAALGTDSYYEQARRECRAYINQLRRVFGNEPEGARLSIKSNAHDFGTYLSVSCSYDDSLPASLDYAFRCENESPEHWDHQARQELAGERT
jgi:hypothetical protein